MSDNDQMFDQFAALLLENSTLRYEKKALQRQLTERNETIASLQTQLASCRALLRQLGEAKLNVPHNL